MELRCLVVSNICPHFDLQPNSIKFHWLFISNSRYSTSDYRPIKASVSIPLPSPHELPQSRLASCSHALIPARIDVATTRYLHRCSCALTRIRCRPGGSPPQRTTTPALTYPRCARSPHGAPASCTGFLSLARACGKGGWLPRSEWETPAEPALTPPMARERERGRLRTIRQNPNPGSGSAL